jgi:hypothetical protein
MKDAIQQKNIVILYFKDQINLVSKPKEGKNYVEKLSKLLSR